jgi:hypothetical protein
LNQTISNNPLNGIGVELKILFDSTAHSEYGVLIWCDIGGKPVECSELACLIWWIVMREHTYKKD